MKARSTKQTGAVVGLLCVAGLPAAAAGQQDMVMPSETFGFTGAFEEFRIPDFRGSVIQFSVAGADGGDAATGGNLQCSTVGGQGFTAVISAAIGDGPTQLPPGSQIRFIVGQGGESGSEDRATGDESGGGGGGSAVAFKLAGPSALNRWQLLAVGGGGGGAHASSLFGNCVNPNQDGRDAQTGPDGGNTDAPRAEFDVREGGENGEAGEMERNTSPDEIDGGGSGGGAIGDFSTDPEQGGGLRGAIATFFAGDIEQGRVLNPTGGSGGATTEQDGGFGFGGGGAGFKGGGGGGGFSGGGGGDIKIGGGGGGTFLADAFAVGDAFVTNGSPLGRDGYVEYLVVAQLHDEPSNALPVVVESDGAVQIRGLATGATESEIPGFGSPGRDVWYRYSNDSMTCSELVSLTFPAGVTIVATTLDGTPIIGSATGRLEVIATPGESVLFRVGSFDESFFIGGDVGVLDTDADGLCDDVDICPDIDDALVDFSADVDSDGIPDACDKACIADLWPDREFTSQDTQELVVTLAFGDPESMLDLNEDGTFDYFDIVRFFEFCD